MYYSTATPGQIRFYDKLVPQDTEPHDPAEREALAAMTVADAGNFLEALKNKINSANRPAKEDAEVKKQHVQTFAKVNSTLTGEQPNIEWSQQMLDAAPEYLEGLLYRSLDKLADVLAEAQAENARLREQLEFATLQPVTSSEPMIQPTVEDELDEILRGL